MRLSLLDIVVQAALYPFELMALILLAILLWYFRGLTRSLRIVAEQFLFQIEPQFEVELSEQRIEGDKLRADLTIMAVENPAVFRGGRFQLYTCADELILDLPLDSWAGRSMMLGQGFRVPVNAILSRDERGTAKGPYYTGWLIYSDARSLAHYKVTFSSLSGNEVRRTGRPKPNWLRLIQPRNRTALPLPSPASPTNPR